MHDQPLSILARWIGRRNVVSVRRRESWLLPRFQFAEPEIEPLPVVGQVVAEMSAVLDDAAPADWFFLPNVWLGGCRPVCPIHDRAKEVYGMARGIGGQREDDLRNSRSGGCQSRKKGVDLMFLSCPGCDQPDYRMRVS